MKEFKEKFFEAIKEGKSDDAFNMFFAHMTKMRFLDDCGLVLRPSMKHRIGFATDISISKKDGGFFSLWHVLDWVTQKLLVQTFPNSPIETEIQLDLEKGFLNSANFWKKVPDVSISKKAEQK